MNDRLRRIEATCQTWTRSASQTAELERYCELVEHVRKNGRDVPVPDHLLAHRDLDEELSLIAWLRSSGSGWDTDPDAIVFLAEWERDLCEI